MGYYRKRIKPGSSQEKFYKAMGFPCLSDTDSLIIRITLGDMDIIDGFYISLPSEAEGLSIEDAIKKYVLSENIKSEIMRKLSQISNLDLLDIYNALLFIYGDAKIGKIRISYHINNGPSYINPAEPVNKYCQTLRLDNDIEYKLLDLVLEIHENIETIPEMDIMLEELRGIFILYLMDKFGYLMDEREYFITPKGYDYLNRIIDEVEFYIDNYDIYGDVYVKSSGQVCFNTSFGDNIIVPILKKDGINPYRAIFVIAMYLGNLDWIAEDPILLFSDEIFFELFDFIFTSSTIEEIGEEILDRIIKEGKSKIEEQKLREARVNYIENIERYMKN